MSDSLHAVTMPKWGLAMEEGMLVAWLAAEGAEVAAGEDLADIETTKITNVFESPASGVLRRLVVGEGETVPVGALLAVIADSTVSDDEIESFVAGFAADFAVRAEEAGAEAPAPESVEVDGRAVSYLEMGEGEGPPLVLIHGFGGDLNNWMFNQLALAEARRVIALDLPGHGASSKDVGEGDLAALAAAVAGLLDALSIERAHLAGHSLGGAVALRLALDRPGRVASLTLLAPAGLGMEINGAYIEGFIAAGRRKEMKTVVGDLFANPDLVTRDLVEALLRYKRLDGVEPALRAIAEGVFPGGAQAEVLRDRLAELGVPVQVVWGREDRIIPAGHGEDLPGEIRSRVLDGVGHMVHMEAAGEVNRLLTEILD
jgi:pyruvate dehydrogenase E2 component (dihydrolipoamide acetyltransferase)